MIHSTRGNLAHGAEKYVGVAPAIPLSFNANQVYTYRVPEGMHLKLYDIVQIPFGKRSCSGVVVQIHIDSSLRRIRNVFRKWPSGLTPQQFEFGSWIAKAMRGGLGYTLRMFMPPHPLGRQKEGDVIFGGTELKRHTSTRECAIGSFDTRWKHMYGRLAASIERGRQALVLIPELWMLERILQSVPGTLKQHMAIVHGACPRADLRDSWSRLYSGKPTIVIGTHKALYLPFRALDQIVIEEEHLATHKSWVQYPRLDNRRGASILAGITGASVTYGDSVPSLAVWSDVMDGIMKGPYDPLVPNVDIITNEYGRTRSELPQKYVSSLRRWILKRDTIAVVMSRRNKDVVQQHELLARHSRSLNIGTQSVISQCTGVHVDHVVWLYPELHMQYPDFRSEEQAYQLLLSLQNIVAGRSSVTIVTSDEKGIRERLVQQISTIYERIRLERKKFKYPPFGDLVRLSVIGISKEAVVRRAENIRAALHEQPSIKDYALVRGPYESFRKQFGKHERFLLLRGSLPKLINLYRGLPVDRVDIDPASLFS